MFIIVQIFLVPTIWICCNKKNSNVFYVRNTKTIYKKFHHFIVFILLGIFISFIFILITLFTCAISLLLLVSLYRICFLFDCSVFSLFFFYFKLINSFLCNFTKYNLLSFYFLFLLNEINTKVSMELNECIKLK